MNHMSRIVRSLLAVVGGYLTMILGLFLAQDIPFGRVDYHTSSLAVLVTAGTLSCLAAILGGSVGAWIGGRYELLHALLMCILLSAEFTTLIATDKLSGPLWFDLGATLSLAVGIVVGALGRRHLVQHRTALPA